MRYIATALILVSAAIGIHAESGTGGAATAAAHQSLSTRVAHQPHMNPFMIGNRTVRTS